MFDLRTAFLEELGVLPIGAIDDLREDYRQEKYKMFMLPIHEHITNGMLRSFITYFS